MAEDEKQRPTSSTEPTELDTPTDRADHHRTMGLFGAVVAAILASLCCIGPLVLLALGIGGAWAGSLTALEPYRPLFLVFTTGALGYAFYRVYRRPREECAPGSTCGRPAASRFNMIALWVVTILVGGLVAVPWLIGPSGKQGKVEAKTGHKADKTGQVTLALENMTCGGCTVTVTKALKQARGVVKVVVTLEPPRAVITYDSALTGPKALSKATKAAGFPSRILRGGG